MLAFTFKLIFSALTTLSNLITRLIFTATAGLLLLFIHAFKVPGEALQGALEQVAEAIKTCFEYILELVWEIISTIISTVIDNLIEVITGSAAFTGSALGDLVEKTRTSLEGLLNDVPEIIEGFSEMITTMVTDLWNNYNDAVGHVTENA